jgi:antitoxin component YwqK of YwqJK toxin-antitoxin module
MKRILPFLLLLISSCAYLMAQPAAPNKTDNEGRRKGKWVFYFYEENAPEKTEAYLTSYYIAQYKKGIPDGLTREYDKSGKLLWEGALTHILPDTLNGISRYFYDDGTIASEYMMMQNKVHGLARKYYPSGRLQWECNYTDDYPDGVYTEYYESGKVMRTGPVVMGKKQGLFTFYYSDEQQSVALVFFNCST